MGQTQLTRLQGVDLLRLDPGVPYLIVLPPDTPTDTVHQLVGFFSRGNIYATVLVGDYSKLRVLQSLPWRVESALLPETYCEGHDTKAPKKKAGTSRKAKIDEIVGKLEEYLILPDGGKATDRRADLELIAEAVLKYGGESSYVTNGVLSAQNSGILGNGVMGMLRADYPKPLKSAKKPTKRAKK